MDRLIIHADAPARLDFGAELADDLPIDTDAPGLDDRLALPPRADAGMGQNFMKAFHVLHSTGSWTYLHAPKASLSARTCSANSASLLCTSCNSPRSPAVSARVSARSACSAAKSWSRSAWEGAGCLGACGLSVPASAP